MSNNEREVTAFYPLAKLYASCFYRTFWIVDEADGEVVSEISESHAEAWCTARERITSGIGVSGLYCRAE